MWRVHLTSFLLLEWGLSIFLPTVCSLSTFPSLGTHIFSCCCLVHLNRPCYNPPTGNGTICIIDIHVLKPTHSKTLYLCVHKVQTNTSAALPLIVPHQFCKVANFPTKVFKRKGSSVLPGYSLLQPETEATPSLWLCLRLLLFTVKTAGRKQNQIKSMR